MELAKDVHYTYADYLTWGDDVRYELIHGIPYPCGEGPTGMAGASQRHQEILGTLYSQLYSFLKGKPCKAFMAPFDVRLAADDDDDIVLQPDLLVVCDKSKLTGKGCKGAPDMVMEILSPSSARRDRITKFNLYRNAGVREYWIVDPETRAVQVCLLENGKYVMEAYADTEEVPVRVLEGCRIRLADVFAE